MRRIYSADNVGGIMASASGWIVFEADDYNVPRIDITFDPAPTSAGLITFTKLRTSDPTFESIVYTVNPVGQTAVSVETLHGFVNGDVLKIQYSNPDAVDITATAATELPLIGDLSYSGITADNGLVRSYQSNYRRYYHIGLGAIAPGASGAVWEPCDSNAIAGWLIDTPTEVLYAETDIHDDWDTSKNPVLESTFTVMEAGTDPADELRFVFSVSYASDRNQTIRTQTFSPVRTVGLIPQYTVIHAEAEIPRDVVDNPILPGDTLCLELRLSALSDIGAVRINSASFNYPTTHVGIESTDA